MSAAAPWRLGPCSDTRSRSRLMSRRARGLPLHAPTPLETQMDEQASRRGALKGIGATLAAAPLLTAGVHAAAQPGRTPGAVVTHPADKYPKPPFPEQKQDFPGLASKMNPVPDHGEKTYVGSGRL